MRVEEKLLKRRYKNEDDKTGRKEKIQKKQPRKEERLKKSRRE